nr:zinc finger, CCHC-type [Tanacetum cinerariifolium]
MEQYNELLRILGQYTQHGLKMDEFIFVSSIIDKLPSFWKDFKHTLKHGKDDLSLVQLGSHLRREESLRAQDSDKGKSKEIGGPSVNMTEEDKNKHNVDAIAWWIDSGATTHVCKDVLYMGDEHFASVHGKGSVALEFSSEKTVTLFNELYVPKLRNNLVYGPVLNKCGYKQVYESNKAIVRLPDPKRKTFGEKGIDCIFVGYADHSKAYKFYVIEPNDSNFINSIIESRDAIFDENRFSSILRPKDIILNMQESQMDDHTDDVPNEIPEPRKAKRVWKAKSYGSDFQLYFVEGSIGSQYSYCYSI